MVEKKDTGITIFPWGQVAREFDVFSPIVLPPDAWAANMNILTAQCTLVTRFKVTLIPHDLGRGAIFFSTSLKPGELGKTNLPARGRIPSGEAILERVIENFVAPALPSLAESLNEAGFNVMLNGRAHAAETFAGAFRKCIKEMVSACSRGETREEEVNNPHPYSCLTLFFSQLEQGVTLVISTSGFHLRFADDRSHEEILPEELKRVAPKYLTTGGIAHIMAMTKEIISRARDYRGRNFSGLTRASFKQPYAFFASGLLDDIDAAAGLDQSAITGCVVAVERLSFPAPGHLVTCTVGPDCRDEHERLAEKAG